ncbi:MAG: bifunctional nuclease family protein [Planctomycetaceae bacterium]|jgi:bifunctional DNase/RNase|nr:bifunctional nuclease family protein [Planctomycetaceae bacterium]
MPIRLELARIVITEITNQHALILREVNGNRELPIVIGIFEETIIERRVKRFEPPRPLTHDLLCNAIEILGGKIQDIFIHRFEEETFFAVLRVVHGNELIEIDCRPSDAIAVAVSFDPFLPILIQEDVLDQAIALSIEN